MHGDLKGVNTQSPFPTPLLLFISCSYRPIFSLHYVAAHAWLISDLHLSIIRNRSDSMCSKLQGTKMRRRGMKPRSYSKATPGFIEQQQAICMPLVASVMRYANELSQGHILLKQFRFLQEDCHFTK